MKLNTTGLVVVVMILALSLILVGCPGPAGNKTPDFLEVGGSYIGRCSAGSSIWFTVVEIRNDGWILCDQGYWINTTQLVWIGEEQ